MHSLSNKFRRQTLSIPHTLVATPHQHKVFSQTFTPGNNVYHKRSEASLQLASLGSNIYRNGVSIPSSQRMIEVDNPLYLVEAVGHGRKLGIEQRLSGGEHFAGVLRTVQHQQL